jgi:hypothetical protein
METLGVTAVDSLLGTVRRGLGPIVVLEVTAPSHTWEAARQLLLRNTFAHQLYGLGTAVAVLAIGPLTDPYDVDAVRELVPRALVGADEGTRTLRDLWERVTSMPVEQRDAVGTLAAAALFVEDPVTVPLVVT